MWHCLVGEAFDQLKAIIICALHESALRQGPGVIMHLPREGEWPPAMLVCLHVSRRAHWVVEWGARGSTLWGAHIKRNHLGRPCRLQKEHGRMPRHESQLTNCYHRPTSSNVPTQPFMQEAGLCLLQPWRENSPLPVHAITHVQAFRRFCQSQTKALDARVARRRTDVSSRCVHCPHEANPGSRVRWVLPAELCSQCELVAASERKRDCKTLGVRVLRCH